MPVKVVPTFVIENLDSIELIGTFTITGAYPVGGDIVDFTTAVGYQSPNGRIFAPAGPMISGSGAVSGSGGDTFSLVPGTLLSNNKLIANTATATVVSGNWGAEVTADTNIAFTAVFPKG